jgi:2'-5' RNA ligase
MTTKRLFIGIPLQPSVNEKINDFISHQQEHQCIRWIPESNRHVTLLFLGNVEEYMLNKMIEQMDKVAASFNTFELDFDHYHIAPKRNPIWFGPGLK